LKYVPATQISADIENSVLERLNYLVSLDLFAFQQKLSAAPDLTVGLYYLTVPTRAAVITDLRLTLDDYERNIELIDEGVFNQMYPAPQNNAQGKPVHACMREGESKVYFDKPADGTLSLEWGYYEIPTDATSSAYVANLNELAKLTLVRWAAADGFRMLNEFDRAEAMENEGNRFLTALKRRYHHSMQENARFVSIKEIHARKRTS